MKYKKFKKTPGDIEIDIEDVEIIMGTNFKHLSIFLDSTFCGTCEKHSTTIESNKILLTKLDDIVFHGQCIWCKNPVARYVETGERKSSAEVARHIRSIKKEFKRIKPRASK